MRSHLPFPKEMAHALLPEKQRRFQSLLSRRFVMAATYMEVERNAVSRVGISSVVMKRVGEGFWFFLCLVLFMILGPFAAPIALAFLFSRQVTGTSLTAEPDPIREG